MHRSFFIALAAVALVCSACGQSQMVKDSWKFTKRQYSNYLNTPAELDMDDQGSCEAYELALGEAVHTIDTELQRLVRAMENSDHNPDQAWVMSMVGRFPWLSGVALVDKNGALVAQYPEHFAKVFDVTPLLEPDPKQRPGDLRAYAQITDAGPEVYIANPVYGAGAESLRGLIVCHFDPRMLATMTHDPGAFALASPAGLLWPGRYGAGSILATQDWAESLRKKSYGTIGDSNSGFFWTTRYIGNFPIVYALSLNAVPSSLAAEGAPVVEKSALRAAEQESSADKAPGAQAPAIRQEAGALEQAGGRTGAIPEADLAPRPETPAPEAPPRTEPQ